MSSDTLSANKDVDLPWCYHVISLTICCWMGLNEPHRPASLARWISAAAVLVAFKACDRVAADSMILCEAM